MNKESIYEEKQYLGRNVYWLNLRLVLAVFSFLAYAFSSVEGDLFLMVGISIIVLSIIMSFVTHFKTTLTKEALILDSLWTTRKVKIDLLGIEEVKKGPYSKYLLNPPVYNQHMKGKIRFYTNGHWAVMLKDKDGLEYKVGTQHPELLYQELSSCLKAIKK